MSGSDLHTTGCNQPKNSEMLTTIDDLPEEVLLEVFSYLLLPDRKHVRLVNKKWNELCYSARFTKHETFCFNSISDLNNINISRTISNLLLDSVDITNATLQLPFWKEHGCRVKSLEIRYCSIIDPVLCDIINHCPNIEHLSLRSARFWPDDITNDHMLSNKLESLEQLELELGLNGVNSESDFALDMLARNVPKLKLFSLSIAADVLKRDSIFMNTMSFIKRQSHTLETLYLNHYNYGSFFNSLGEQVGVQLTCLYIPSCIYVTDNLLFEIAKKFVNLERLDISLNDPLGRNMDSSLFLNLKKLKLVSLSFTSITDKVLFAVAALEQIEGIDLTHCLSLTAEGISRAFGTKLHEKMLDIRLGYNRCVTDQVLAQILPQLPNLRSIDLTRCREISPVGVSAITTNCKLLKLLNIAHCLTINSISTPDMNDLKGLLYLNLSGCSLDADTIGKLKYLDLQVITLVFLPLTVEGLTSLLANCPSLQYVQVYNDVDHVSVTENLARETERKCPTFLTRHVNYAPQTIFELSARHFNRFPCNRY